MYSVLKLEKKKENWACSLGFLLAVGLAGPQPIVSVRRWHSWQRQTRRGTDEGGFDFETLPLSRRLFFFLFGGEARADFFLLPSFSPPQYLSASKAALFDIFCANSPAVFVCSCPSRRCQKRLCLMLLVTPELMTAESSKRSEFK